MNGTRLLAGIICIVAADSPGIAHAQTTSDQMTCQQAVSTYERTGSGTVVPIYRPAPVSQRSSLYCRTREHSRSRYNVRNSDKRDCTIGFYCS